MYKRLLLASVALAGAVALTVSAGAAPTVSMHNQFRTAMYEHCITNSVSPISCHRKTANWMKIRSDIARADYKQCLADGGTRAECDAERDAYYAAEMTKFN